MKHFERPGDPSTCHGDYLVNHAILHVVFEPFVHFSVAKLWQSNNVRPCSLPMDGTFSHDQADQYPPHCLHCGSIWIHLLFNCRVSVWDLHFAPQQRSLPHGSRHGQSDPSTVFFGVVESACVLSVWDVRSFQMTSIFARGVTIS